MTHDYKRNGTTTLFAALHVLTGGVIGQCLPRHRNGGFLRFLRTVDRQVPKRLQIHIILDNYGTHTHDNVVAGLDKHPRFHLHFIPTSSSWLNMVERWFRELTEKAIRRGVFKLVPDLIVVMRGIPPSQQQRSQAVRMDRHGRGDPRESQPRPGRTRINPG